MYKTIIVLSYILTLQVITVTHRVSTSERKASKRRVVRKSESEDEPPESVEEDEPPPKKKAPSPPPQKPKPQVCGH